MEEKVKRKVELNFAGLTLTLVTDESESNVRAIEKLMDDNMGALLGSGKISQFDAALLSAIEFCGDKLTAEKKMRNLEAQVSLYEVNLRRLKNEVASLKKKLGEGAEAEPQSEEVQVELPDEQMSIEENIAANEEKTDSRAEKLRKIESLLKKNW